MTMANWWSFIHSCYFCVPFMCWEFPELSVVPKEFPPGLYWLEKRSGACQQSSLIWACMTTLHWSPHEHKNSVHACANLCQLMSNLTALHFFLLFCLSFLLSQPNSSSPFPFLPDYASYPQVAWLCLYYNVVYINRTTSKSWFVFLAYL